MIRTAIVEDDTAAADLLAEYLDRYSEETDMVFQVKKFPNPISFLENYKADYDIVFMDIKMDHMDGLRAAKILRSRDKRVTLIFVTNMAQYAINGYEVDALDFILKPVKYYDFVFRIKKAIDRITAAEEKFLSVNLKGGGCVKLIISHIKYVEIMKHKIVYHSEDGDYESYGTLKNVEDILVGCNFVRCNSCYLVNLKFVTTVQDFTVDVGGDKLKISQPKKKDFMRALADFIGGGA